MAVAIIAVALGGVFVLSNWNTNRAQQVLLAEQARLIRLTIDAAEAQIAILTADAENAAAEIGALTAEARVNATGTVRAERTAAQATFDSHMMETARIVTHEAAVAGTQAAQTARQAAKYQVGNFKMLSAKSMFETSRIYSSSIAVDRKSVV